MLDNVLVSQSVSQLVRLYGSAMCLATYMG